MKKMLLFPLGLIFYTFTISQNSYTIYPIDANEPAVIVVNKIKKELVYVYTFTKNGIRDSSLTTVYRYDALGRRVEERSLDTRNHTESISTYKNIYLGTGKLRKQIVEKPAFKMYTVYEFDYDSAGNELDKYDYNKDTTRLTIEQKSYNEKNHLVAIRTKRNDFEMYTSKKYYYNEDNDLSKMEVLEKTGEVMLTYTYEYNKSRHKTTLYIDKGDGRRKQEEAYYNNDNQLLKEYTTLNRRNLTNNQSSQYHNYEKLTENIYNPDKTLFETNIYIDGEKEQMNRHFYPKE